MKGSAGQSFCAFLAKGVYVQLEGDANDYVCKVSQIDHVCESYQSQLNIVLSIYPTVVHKRIICLFSPA